MLAQTLGIFSNHVLLNNFNHNIDFTAYTPGSISLPSWVGFSCASSRTCQTSASTLANISANTPCIYFDGTHKGFQSEESRTNYCIDTNFLTKWVGSKGGLNFQNNIIPNLNYLLNYSGGLFGNTSKTYVNDPLNSSDAIYQTFNTTTIDSTFYEPLYGWNPTFGQNLVFSAFAKKQNTSDAFEMCLKSYLGSFGSGSYSHIGQSFSLSTSYQRFPLIGSLYANSAICTSAIGSSDTTLTVGSGAFNSSFWSNGDTILVNNEVMTIASIAGSTFTVTRTSPTTHPSYSTVYNTASRYSSRTARSFQLTFNDNNATATPGVGLDNGNYGCVISCPQLEAGKYLTSYMPNTNITESYATRQAGILTPALGSASSLSLVTGFVAMTDSSNLTTTPYVVAGSVSSDANFSIGYNSSNKMTINFGSTHYVSTNSYSWSQFDSISHAISINGPNASVAVYKNGTLMGVENTTLASSFALNHAAVCLGSDYQGNHNIGGWIQNISAN